ncbi:MAG: hypothetical protein JXL80_05575 [Planctomycetes bacterium]|nr:hypothetical protein [Planctomycetota bacterium]
MTVAFRHTFSLTLVAAAVLITLCGCTRADEGIASQPVASPYAQWKNGPSADPDFFPIAVYLQAPKNASRYKEIGINLYIDLWQGPTEEQLAELRRHGMKLICQQNEVGLKHLDDPMIVGWMQVDEPDNAQSMARAWKSVEAIRKAWPNPEDKQWHERTLEEWGDWGPPYSPQQIVSRYREMVANDPTRPVYLGLGVGVAWDGWAGRRRADHPQDYPRYIEGADIVGFDIYPFATSAKPIIGRVHYVPYGVRRLVNWSQGRKIVWNSLECTAMTSVDRKPTPEQVRAEVWMSLVHGSTGIIYFAHVMEKERFSETGLLDDEAMARAVGKTNHQIARLARVLNSPTVPLGATVQADPPDVSCDNAKFLDGLPVATMVKRHDGATYLFAVRMEDSPCTATFQVKGLPAKATAEVIDEDRKIDVTDGRLADRFDGYGVHLYKIAPAK